MLSPLFFLATILFLSFASTDSPLELFVGNYQFIVQSSGRNLLFGKKADQKDLYSLQFHKLQEVVRVTNEPIPNTKSNLNGNWSITALTRTMDGAKFGMSLEKATFGNISFAFTIIFPNVSNANRTSCPAEFCLKFDVNLTDYHWMNKSDPNLGLVFSMQGPPVQNTTQQKSNVSVSVGQSFFSVVPTARVTNQFGNVSRTTNVSINYNNKPGDDEGIWVIYGGFPSNWNLFHDPAVGLDPDVIPSPPYVISDVVFIGLGVSAAVILVLVILGVAYLYKQRQLGYEPVRS